MVNLACKLIDHSRLPMKFSCGRASTSYSCTRLPQRIVFPTRIKKKPLLNLRFATVPWHCFLEATGFRRTMDKKTSAGSFSHEHEVVTPTPVSTRHQGAEHKDQALPAQGGVIRNCPFCQNSPQYHLKVLLLVVDENNKK